MKSTIYQIGRFFRVICILTVFLFAGEADAQKTFAKKIIEAGSPIATVQTSSGKYVSVSEINSAAFTVRKTDSKGKRLWERSFQFDLNNTLEAVGIGGIAQTTDGGYVLAGSGLFVDLVPTGLAYGILIKLKPSGHLEWAKRFSKSSGSDLRLAFTSVSAAPDGGFAVTGIDCVGGSTICDGARTILLTLNSSGTVVSARSFGSRTQGGNEIVTASSGGFILTFSSAHSDTFAGTSVIRVSDAGKILWGEFYKNFLFRAVSTRDDGVILAGGCFRHSCGNDLFLLKLKNNGQSEWNGRFTSDKQINFISDIRQSLDGGYLITANGTLRNLTDKFVILKIDSSGKLLFGTTYGENNSNETVVTWGNQIFESADGGFFLFGFTGLFDLIFGTPFDTLLLKLNSEGLVSDCSLSDPLNISTRHFGKLKIGTPEIKQENFSVEEAVLQVNLSTSKKQVSTACP